MSDALQKNISSWLPGLLLGVVMGVYTMLRLRFVDHVLTWDEAMNLLSTQAFFSGQENPYSFWFWRHPPLYPLMLGVFRHTGHYWSGYAVLLNVGLGLGLVLALLRLQTLAVGRTAALWSAACYALMPAAIFFDVWIKRDILVNLFGLLALFAFFTRRPWIAGIWLGLAFLSKELAAFYVLPMMAAVLIEKDKTVWRDLVKTGAATVLFSLWWYVFFSSALVHYFSFVTGLDIVETEKWANPWTDVWSRLPLNLGWAGLLLLVPGVWLLTKHASSGGEGGVMRRSAAWWPLALMVPALIVLTVIKGKTPWFIIPVLPAFAALQGAGIACLFQHVREHSAALRGWVMACALSVCLGLLVRTAGRVDYDEVLSRQSPGMAWGSQASAAAARAVNEALQPGERWAATPMFYWQGEEHALCPILLCALNRLPDAAWAVPATADELWANVQAENMDWVLVSPTLEAANDLIEPLILEHKAKATLMNGSILLDCRKVAAP